MGIFDFLRRKNNKTNKNTNSGTNGDNPSQLSKPLHEMTSIDFYSYPHTLERTLPNPSKSRRKHDFITYPEEKPRDTPWNEFAASYREIVLGKKEEKKGDNNGNSNPDV